MIEKKVAKGEPGQIRYEKRDHIVYFIFDGSNDLNACTTEMYADFYEYLVDFRDDVDSWVGVLTGAGDRAFNVGGDLKEMLYVSESASPETASKHFWYPRTDKPYRTSQIAEEIFTLELFKPIIGAVNGLCLGGGLVYLLALTDIRIAAEDAQLGFSEVKRGLGGGGGFSGIAQQVPLTTAMWLCLTGETIDATEALRLGIINEVVQRDRVHDRAQELAEMLCENSPTILKLEKELLLRSRDMPRRDLLRLSWAMHFATRYAQDATEGLAAFREKRTPSYRGW